MTRPGTPRGTALRQWLACGLAGVLGFSGLTPAVGAQGGAGTPQTVVSSRVGGAVAIVAASVVGSAWNSDNSPIPQAKVRLRDIVSGKVVSSTIADDDGQFLFEQVAEGAYVVELIDDDRKALAEDGKTLVDGSPLTDDGQILAIGHPLTVTGGETVATFVRLGTKVPFFYWFFSNTAIAVAAAAAATGVIALAPDEMDPVSSRQ